MKMKRKIIANPSVLNALRNLRACAQTPESSQAVDIAEVTQDSPGQNTPGSAGFAAVISSNCRLDNSLSAIAARAIHSNSNKALSINDLRGSEPEESRDKSEKNGRSLIAPSTLLRWCIFNLVGGMGIIVQVAALFLLKRILHFDYLAATAIAVEAAVVHNFVWHEQFTWADRTISDRTISDRTISDRGMSWRRSLLRLLRFNLTTGAVSILGNLALMKVMVGQGHMNYLLANAVAIILCSLANFLVSETWVFEKQS
jgi:putative flippase GtrA